MRAPARAHRPTMLLASRFPPHADVITLEKSGDALRLMYDTKGRFVLHTIGDAEKDFKLARVVSEGVSAKQVPFVVTHDGRTIRYPDPLIKKNDTVKIDLASGKIVDFVKFEVGSLVTITRGRNAGRIGVLHDIESHPGSFDIVHVKDTTGAVFATRLPNAFVLGKTESLVSLPRGKGIKHDIFADRLARMSKA
ncbi:40S ribosomal protein S4 [archaeon]|nr:MAG: 40S ribosomal protein S4 [archaeon]